MTALRYITDSKIATTVDILHLKREDSKGFDTLVLWAKQEMQHNGISVDEPLKNAA